MEKKLKTWQIILLIIFYPIGILYLIVKYASKTTTPQSESSTDENSETEVSHFDLSKAEIENDFYSKVVGVTFKNADGSDRQKIVSECKAGDDIIFKPVPTKQYPDAIGVFTTNGKQLGHVKSELALELKEKYPTHPMQVTIASITGGNNGANYGCNLHIVIYKKQ